MSESLFSITVNTKSSYFLHGCILLIWNEYEHGEIIIKKGKYAGTNVGAT